MTTIPAKFEPRSVSEADAMADSVLQKMTRDEKIDLVGGDKGFFIRGVPRLGLQEAYMSDATQGVHIRRKFGSIDISKYALDKSTAFPAPICLAATWDPALAYRYAESIGEECRAGGISILLGPGMNEYRISECGRNFEYFGEDPYLRARMIEEYVQGLQSTGTIATLKHFVANNAEFYRRRSNSIVDERTLHEIYLPPFEAGVKAGAKAVMTSYNQLNGEWCGQDSVVITKILRGDLGFQWLVMTDWESVYDGVKVVKSGQDLEMPKAEALKDLRQLLDEGKIQMEDIEGMDRAILRTYFVMRLDQRKQEPSFEQRFPQHSEVALQTAREGIVLLKNLGSILPLPKTLKNILLTGTFVDTLAVGGGSATVKGYDSRLMLDELRKEFGSALHFVNRPTKAQIAGADVVLCNVGTKDSEGWDRPFALPEEEESRVLECVENNPRTVVIVSTGSGVRMTGWNEKAAAILYAWYNGQNGNTALAEVIAGKSNPSGKLPMTIEKEFNDTPGYDYLPAGEELFTGWLSEREHMHPVFDVAYKEGIFVGYRWFDKQHIEPLYPFGFGLSYTKFEYGNLRLSKKRISEMDTVVVTFDLKNVGTREGAEIPQVYVQEVASPVPRPVKELKGFQRVVLNEGQSEIVSISLNNRAFAHWDTVSHSWVVDRGVYNVLVGASSADIRLTESLEVH